LTRWSSGSGGGWSRTWRARLRGRVTRMGSYLNLHLVDEAVCAAEVASRSPREVLALLHRALRTRGFSTPRGLSTLSTPRDERALDGTGQAFAEFLEELRRAAAVHRGALPRAAALASSEETGKKVKGDAQLHVLVPDNTGAALQSVQALAAYRRVHGYENPAHTAALPANGEQGRSCHWA